MASDSSTSTATIPEKPLEKKVNEEAKLMEKEIGSSEKESVSLVEEVGAVVKAEESTETEKHENGEKGAEQVELREPNLVKESVAEVNVKGGDVEKAEEKPTMENVVEENSKDKEVTKIVDAPELAYEAAAKQVEPVDVQSVRDVSAETAEEKIKDVEALEAEPKPEVSEKVETQPEKVKELAPEIEVVKAEDKPESTEQAKVELQGQLDDITVEAKDSGNSKDEQTSESASALSPEEIVLTKQESDTDPKKEVEEDVSCPADVIEKAITEEKHVVDEPSKDEKTPESALCPEEIVPTKTQESDTGLKGETEGDASSPTEEKHVVDELSKDEKSAVLCPEIVVPSSQVSETNQKEEIEGGASSLVVVTEKATTEEKHAVDEPLKDETASLCPETVVPSDQDSETNTKEKTEGDASTADDVIDKTITEEKHVVDEPSKEENPSESGPTLCPEKVVPTNQDILETNPEKETEGDVSSPADIIEKAITEEKQVVEEPSKDEQETVHKAKDLRSILATEDENIKKDTADGKSEETSKETDTESREKETAATRQEETITEKVAEVIETAPVVKESDEPKQQAEEVTAKEVLPVKQKHSNSIISKVKQSLVKAKKAIIGKSPSSKTITTEEAKEEIKVK